MCKCACYWYWDGLLVLWGANGEIMKSEKRGDYGYVCCVCTMVLLAVAR